MEITDIQEETVLSLKIKLTGKEYAEIIKEVKDSDDILESNAPKIHALILEIADALK